jgi:cytochrome c oxidase subunit 1
MSTTTVAHHDDHAEHPTGIMRWLTTTNHKDIGTMYLTFALIMFFVGGAMILGIRAELFKPGLQLMNPEFFNQLIGVHALIMIFAACRNRFCKLDDPITNRCARYGVTTFK